MNDLYSALMSNGSFKALCASIKLAGLEEAFRSPGPWTLFAPTDNAFQKLPRSALDTYLRSGEDVTKLVSFHILSGRLTSAEVRDMYGRVRIQGKKFTIAHGKMRVNGVVVRKPFIPCSNGILQPIDVVLTPDLAHRHELSS